MKNKGVMISLAVILLIGMMITTGTHNFIEKNSPKDQEQVTADAPKAQSVSDEMSMAAKSSFLTEIQTQEEDAKSGGAAERQGERTAGLGDEEGGADMAAGLIILEGEPEDGVQEAALETEPAVVSPAAGLQPSQEDTWGTAKLSAVEEPGQDPVPYYVKRLQDLDSQIQKNRENQPGANVNASVKSAAANELKLWDSELNDIYNAILERLEKEESEALVKEEREWLKERDVLAMEAAKKSAGSSNESIEYTFSLVESTRKRAYELAERYGQVLEP